MMFRGPGPNPLSMLYGLPLLIPPAIAVVYGIALYMRDCGRKPRTAQIVGIAIVLLIIGSLPYYLLMVASWFGWSPPGWFMSLPYLIAMAQVLCNATGLALLFRAAFLSEVPAEYDPGPPVYRNDD